MATKKPTPLAVAGIYSTKMRDSVLKKPKPKKTIVGVVLNSQYTGDIEYFKMKNGQWFAHVKYRGDILFSSVNGNGYARRTTLERMLQKRVADYDLYTISINGKKVS